MGILAIKIKNYKSIKNLSFNFSKNYDAFCLLGTNGAGKSNLLDAIEYFYDRLSSKDFYGENVMDKINMYSQKMVIEIIFDIKPLLINKTNPYLDNVNEQILAYTRDSKLSIKLTQYRNGELRWFPNDFNLRRAIKKLFPLYMIDTRFISLQEWSVLWEIMSELAISNLKTSDTESITKLDECFEDIYGEKYSKSLKRINEILEKEKISINHKNYKTRFMNALQVRLGGNEFVLGDYSLPYNSDGVNSLKYIKLFLRLISSLAETGWKNPLIILDEPEIGLHMNFIDELVECIQDIKSKRVNILFSTHSPYLVAKLVKNDIQVSVSRIFENNNYSNIERMRDIIEDSDKNIVSSRETECYFAKGLAFVEGKTEFQIFQYRKLYELFPQLKSIHFYQSSDGASMRIIDPSNAKYTVPYLIISDMDKILYYKKNHFYFKEDSVINPFCINNIILSERYMYYQINERKGKTYGLRKKIRKVLKNKKFETTLSKYWMDGTDYKYLISCIKEYCMEYQLFPVQTTIEGCLVNHKNTDLFVSWYIEKYPHNASKLQDLLLQPELENLTCKTLLLRLIVNGKTDNLLTIKEAGSNHLIPDHIIGKIKQLSVGKKTGGWVKSFLDYVFLTKIDLCNHYIEKQLLFAEYFPELNYILHLMCSMIE